MHTHGEPASRDNFVARAGNDLGENLRLVLLSVTEGEDKPLKYPTIFNTADVAIITKTELAAAVEFDVDQGRRSIQSVRPKMPVFKLSARTGLHMENWMDELSQRFCEFCFTCSTKDDARLERNTAV